MEMVTPRRKGSFLEPGRVRLAAVVEIREEFNGVSGEIEAGILSA
jgi:hypothetical protein